ncbi:MAG: methyltransferase domain-containing protein [Magnetococcales bacterium]|nr:methyltransferase domain-containing protein [Magnetococcales bacterium]
MNGFHQKEEQEMDGEAPLSDSDFRTLKQAFQKRFSLLISDSERHLLTSCMTNRSRQLGIRYRAEYINHLFDPGFSDEEFVYLMDSLTGFRTTFFRNPEQFEFLAQIALPELIKQHGAGIGRKLVVWSAGCSSGEEPYSLAMVLKQFSEHYPGIQFLFQILATDVSLRTLEKAGRAVFELDQVKPIPVSMKKKFLLKSKDRFKRQVRVVSELRDQVVFRQLDFLDPRFGLRESMDIIFCRDVICYFDHQNREKLINKLCQYLLPGGYLFLGQSESLHHLHVPLIEVGPAIYRLPA